MKPEPLALELLDLKNELNKIHMRLRTDPAPLGRVVTLALPSLAPRPIDPVPVVSPVAATAVLQQLHDFTLVDGVDALRVRERWREMRQGSCGQPTGTRPPPLGYLLARLAGALFQCLCCLQFALATVQRSQTLEGRIHGGAARVKTPLSASATAC